MKRILLSLLIAFAPMLGWATPALSDACAASHSPWPGTVWDPDTCYYLKPNADGSINVTATFTPSGTQDVNEKQVNGATINVGTGAAGTGTARVTTSTDSTIGTVTTVTNPVTVAQPTAASLNATVVGTGTFGMQDTNQNLAQGSTTSGQVGPLIQGSVTTAKPSYTTAQTSPLSINTGGGLRTDLTHVNGTVIVTGTGAQTAGSPRVTVATDTATIAGSAVGTAGTASANVVTVQGIASGTVVPTNTAQVNGVTTLAGTGAVGTGSQRVAVGTDTATIAGSAPGTAGSASTNVVTVQGIASGTNLNANVAQINGVAPTMGNGASGTGVQRVTLANDSTGIVALTTGAATIGALTANQSVNQTQVNGVAVTTGLAVFGTGTQAVTQTAEQSYTAVGNITLAATPGDIFTLVGSATKTVRIRRILIGGVATAAGTINVQILRRSTADTGGTFVDQGEWPLDTNNNAATANAGYYTANPTKGTLAAQISYRSLTLSTAASSAVPEVPMEATWGAAGAQAFVLRGVNDFMAIDLVGQTVTGGVVQVTVEWTESAS